MFNFDLRPLVVLAAVGAIAVVLAVLVGIPMLVHYLWTHLSWTP